jgi:hypothetical protein
MVEIDNHSFIQTVSLVALAVVAFSVGIQKLLKDWKSTNINAYRARAHE